MGLGLFLTRAVIERLGGQLVLASQVGRGTRVTVTLPAVER
jgi:two-component system sensor histidine kinase RegB